MPHAAPQPAPRAPARSASASRLLADLAAITPDVRRGFLASLARDELEQVLLAADLEMGTPYGLWADDPAGFTEDVLGDAMWSVPRRIMQAVATSKRVAVPSCYGSSKTHSASRLVLWRAFTAPVKPTLIVTLAPKWSQVHRQLWPEIRSAHSRAGLPGAVDMAQLKLTDRDGYEKVVAYGKAVQPWDENAVQGVHCFDSDTELLTDQGWKFFPDVTGDERVLTLDGDSAVWGPITKVWRHDFDGYLNLHDGVRVNFCITDNHRLLVGGRDKEYKRHGRVTSGQGEDIKRRRRAGEPAEDLAAEYGVSKWTIYDIASGRRDGSLTSATTGRRWQLIQYSDLPDSFVIRRTNTWGGGSNPDAVRFPAQPSWRFDHPHPLEFAFKDWATFLGWYVAEGWTKEHKGMVGISQSRTANPGKYAEIGALLDRMGIRYGRDAGHLRFTSGPLTEWLREHCGHSAASKRIPACIREATPEMMEAFLEAFGKGDGAAHTHPDSRRYVTSSRQLADDLHEVLCKLGRGRKLAVAKPAGSAGVMSTTGRAFTRNRPTWIINDPGVPVDSNVLKKNVQRVRYTGKVYCVSTPTQVIMVRRKGCPMWSGNSPILLLIVDEAGGIGHVIGRNLRGMLVGENTRMLAIGNPPTDEEGSWFEGLCGSQDVVTIPIPATATPNLSGEQAPRCLSCPAEMPAHSLATHLVDREWVDEAIGENGPESNYVQAKVHARFPKGGPGRAIPAAWVDGAAESPEPDPEDGGWAPLCDLGLADETEPWLVRDGAWVRLGVDVAADGGDELAITRVTGDLAQLVHVSAGPVNANAVDVAGVILAQVRRAEALRRRLGTAAKVRVKIDGIGVGWGVAGVLEAWAAEGVHDAEIVVVIVSEAPDREPESATLRPYRKRDEMWLAGRALLQPSRAAPDGRLRLRVPARMLAQLRGPQMSTSTSGHTVIEAKKRMKKRGLRSPDEAESLLLAVYEPARKRRKQAKLIT
jgi:hypothetical protein